MPAHPLFVGLALFLLSALLSFTVWLVKELHAHGARLALHDERHRRHDARLEELEAGRERRWSGA